LSYDGKRDDRIRVPAQVNADPELGAEIARRAERKHRKKGAQVIYLLAIGLKHDPEQDVHALDREVTHARAQEHTETHHGAPPRMVPHTRELKNGTADK
jgi:hypothetical protein